MLRKVRWFREGNRALGLREFEDVRCGVQHDAAREPYERKGRGGHKPLCFSQVSRRVHLCPCHELRVFRWHWRQRRLASDRVGDHRRSVFDDAGGG
jgi:hypothetical protein